MIPSSYIYLPIHRLQPLGHRKGSRPFESLFGYRQGRRTRMDNFEVHLGVPCVIYLETELTASYHSHYSDKLELFGDTQTNLDVDNGELKRRGASHVPR